MDDDTAADDAYEPDDDDDAAPDAGDDDGTNVPQPRAAQMRKKVLQRRPVTTKQPSSISKGRRSSTRQSSRILAREKQRKALELRKGGASYAQIAEAVGYRDQGGARKAVMRAFADVIQEPVTEVKTIQIERLNHMLLTLWPKVQIGDERAIDTSLRVMDKIDRLMGTEAAQQVDVAIHQQSAILVINGDKDDYIRAMKQMAGVAGDGTNQALPAGLTAPPTGLPAVDAETAGDTDVVDAELVEDGEPDPRDLMPAGTVKKTYKFGVEPRGKQD